MNETTTSIDVEDTPSVYERLSRRLTDSGIPFDVQHHEPVFTSEEAARVRGTALASGAKALICKQDLAFVLFVLPADRKLDSKKVRNANGSRSLRFANREEVHQLTKLQPGSIPPFGSLFELPTYCDQRLGDHPTINFNAGDHSISIRMSFDDFVKVEQPRLGSFAD